ncbi:MAG: tyrosinase family protein [Chloroflexota bacterium]|nr:tyrosinase family protein [Chloroflexota bacterium]
MGRGRAQAPVATPIATPVGGALNVRPNGATLSAEQKKAYTDAVLALKQKPSPWLASISTYDTFVLWHRDAFGCGLSAAHMGPAFFPWHRMFLHLFEQQLQEVDPNVSLPYWDWSADREKDSWLWQDDFMGGNGSPDDDEAVVTGPFAKGKWELTVFDYTDADKLAWLTRDFGAGGLAPDLPTPEQVEAALAIETYDAAPWSASSPIAQSFRNTLEGWRDCVEDMCDPMAGVGTICTGDHMLHNRVHLWVSGEFAFAHELQTGMTADHHATPVAGDEMIFGTMAANSSPNDPVFFQHHANIDRLWSAWMQRHGQQYLPESGGPVGHNIDDAMWPYHQIDMQITPRMMLDSRSLGYIYDTDG